MDEASRRRAPGGTRRGDAVRTAGAALRRAAARAVVVGAVVAAARVPHAAAQASAVRGVVRDDAGAGVPGAVVRFEALRRAVVTDESGRFALAGVPPGRHPAVVRRLGFLPGDFVLDLPAGVAVELLVRMAPSPTPLPSIVVEGERRDYLLHANGYYERARAGAGTFLGPEFLEARPNVALRTLLREVPRLNLRCDPTGQRCAAGPPGCPRCGSTASRRPKAPSTRSSRATGYARSRCTTARTSSPHRSSGRATSAAPSRSGPTSRRAGRGSSRAG
jgi:hypothetical protein